MPNYTDFVFINCPFDIDYRPIFSAIIFTVYRCGFYPVSALSEDDATDNRVVEIEKLIERCKFGIHDISRTEPNNENLPRFNMPFELGLFWGAKRFGGNNHKAKIAVIFDRERYRYMKFISDISGVDIKEHKGDYKLAIQKTRDWLFTASNRRTIPGYKKILKEYDEFITKLPLILEEAGFDEEVSFNDFCLFVEETIKNQLIT